jgi:hypothetical protein
MGESARKHGELEYPISHLTSRYILNQKAARAFFANADPWQAPARSEEKYLDLSRYAVRSALRTFGCIGLFGLLLSAIGLSA